MGRVRDSFRESVKKPKTSAKASLDLGKKKYKEEEEVTPFYREAGRMNRERWSPSTMGN